MSNLPTMLFLPVMCVIVALLLLFFARRRSPDISAVAVFTLLAVAIFGGYVLSFYPIAAP